MTLGLTSSGAVKIKTDGGLRAVNCACCGVCGCDVVRSRATPELIEILQNATAATINGIAADSFDFYGNDPNEPDWPISWQALWCFDLDDCAKYFLYAQWNGWETDPTSLAYQCFNMFGVRDSDPPQIIDGVPVFRALFEGTSSCPPLYPLSWVNSATTNFTINSEKFPCVQSYNPEAPLEPLAIPNFVFT